MPDEAKSVAVGVLRETFPGERRVALIPQSVPPLAKRGLQVLVESQAGLEAGFEDASYVESGATILTERSQVLADADILLQVRSAGANPTAGQADIGSLREGQIVIACCDPLSEATPLPDVAQRGVTTFALELLPRITRAQSMDVLSSMATIAGYKAVMLAAGILPRMFPMLMTAAGTIAPARVFVIGAGVAGLQAIASARRLGALVEAYDLRPAVREEVESLGAKFVELPLPTGDDDGAGGYARAMDEDFYRRQRELMHRVVTESDVVITTAAIPGREAPILVTDEMVQSMATGSVIVDLAAERGGNCSLTQPGDTVTCHGVTILGPLNVPSTIPVHASQMYAKNISTFLLQLVDKEGRLDIDWEDEVIRETLVTRNGEVVHPRVRELLGLPALETIATENE